VVKDFYDQLGDLNLLRRAWHLARNDARTDFMFDPYRYSDFAFRLDNYLQGIAHSLRTYTYHPRSLLTMDIPKSSLSVRPGTVLSIEDKIVLFAIACLIAPPLDNKLPDFVYSWRVKKGKSKKELFRDHEILKFPFLKKSTIIKQVDFIEPWYEAWPLFIQEVKIAYEEQGFKYMVVSDIVAYFENIDLRLLRDLLLHYLPRQPRIINFLISLLEHWTWPVVLGGASARGIPQGNGVSSFLGNIYLLPLDTAFQTFAKRRDVKYLRYIDDVKVLTKDLPTARDALFLMNEKLRELRLNIQGAKTRILEEDKEIRQEFFDPRLEAVNDVIEQIKKKSTLTAQERKDFAEELNRQLKKVKGRKSLIQKNELRLFRRLITGYTLLKCGRMVDIVLKQMEKNPDARLLNSAVRYFRFQERNFKKIAGTLFDFISQDKLLFPYQKAHCFMALRYQRDLPSEVWKEAKQRLRSKKEHWYVRQQAAILVGLKQLSKRELRSLRKLYNEVDNREVKRTLMQSLAQLPCEDLTKLANELLYDSDAKMQRLGRFYFGLLHDDEVGTQKQINSLFDDFQEEILIDRIFEVEVISKAGKRTTRQYLLQKLKNVQNNIRRPLLKTRVDSIISRLEKEIEA